MNLRLLQAIRSLESDEISCLQKADEYRDLQEDVNPECRHALQVVIENYKTPERGIRDCLGILRKEQIRLG